MVKLICIGKIKEHWIKEGISDFEKRISRFEIIELKDSTKEKESEEIGSKIKKEKVYLLDETGTEFSSKSFAELIKKESNEQELLFVIGGPNGFDEELKRKYPKISLSKMTFTHEMARLFFIEQLYRANTIIKNKAYHK